MDLGGHSVVGPREANEDNYYVIDFSRVGTFTNGVKSFLMVSDGMGGYQGGDVASALAVSCAESYIGQLLDMAAGNQVEFDAAFALGEIAQNAHEAILAESRSRGNTSMGATFIGAFLSSTHAWIGHIGDSRAYLVRNDEATQLTTDHSQVGRMLASGLLTEEDAQKHPARNRIERALGFSDGSPEITEVDLAPGDALMLCSDGVYTVLGCDDVADCIQRAKSAEGAASYIVKTALNLGTDDNATAVVALNVERGAALAPKRKSRPTVRAGANVSPSSAPTGRHRAVSYSSRGRPSYQRKMKRRSLRSIVIPITVVIALVLMLVAFFLASGGIGSGGSAVDAGQAPTLSDAGGSQEPGGQIAAVANSAAQYIVGDNVSLKYIDSDGRAHAFNEHDADIPYVGMVPVVEGSVVSASTESGHYGFQDNLYQVLTIDYRMDLLNDRSVYKKHLESGSSGSPSFNSRLSGIIDSTSYLDLLEALASVDGETLEKTVAKLALNESGLSPAD